MTGAATRPSVWQRVFEAVAVAAAVGGVSVYAATAAMGERLDIVATGAAQNARQLRDVNETLTDIRVEMAEQRNLLTLIAAVRGDLAEHEKALDSIWPRLREMKERVQALEPQGAERWKH